jgi:hypothetical protein
MTSLRTYLALKKLKKSKVKKVEKRWALQLDSMEMEMVAKV